MTVMQQKTLRLVTEAANPHAAEGGCTACEAKQRQLEHVKMLLNAALLAASQTAKPPRGKR